MKHIHQLIIVATACITLKFGQPAQATEPLLTPRAQSLQIRIVPGSSAGDPDLTRNRPIGNAKAWETAQSFRKVPSTGRTIDLAHAPRPALPAKDPRYDAALRENAIRQISVAPLK